MYWQQQACRVHDTLILSNRGRQVITLQPDVERGTDALSRIDRVVVADLR